MIYNSFDLTLLKFKNFKGGIGAIDVFESSNLIALTGGGMFPKFKTNKVSIWDDIS